MGLTHQGANNRDGGGMPTSKPTHASSVLNTCTARMFALQPKDVGGPAQARVLALPQLCRDARVQPTKQQIPG